LTDYISVAQLRDYIGSDTSNFEAVAQTACTVASRAVETMCDRVFTADTTATARYFDADSYYCVDVDDFHTVTGLIVATDDAADGTYSTTWTINTDFITLPVNQRQGGIGGWPYTELRSLGTRTLTKPYPYVRPYVKVTAKWGWAAVPDQVEHATLVAAARLFKMKDAADGFIGLDGWGPVRIRENPEVRALLGPFIKHPVSVG
jgi:hypothetical protein